jgi:hypothetical protein
MRAFAVAQFSGIPTGSDRTVTVEGLNSANETAYEGSQTGITVSSGPPADVSITAYVADDQIAYDDVAPEITMNGSSSLTLFSVESYSEPGATATDNKDGDISSNIQITGLFDSTVRGFYTLTYAVSDAAGNLATEQTRNITVARDTENPVITLPGSSTVSLSIGETYVESGASVSDNSNDDLNVQISREVNVNSPGVYSVIYSVSDLTNNAATPVARIVTVTDEDAPTITLIGDEVIDMLAGQEFVDPGATANDSVDGDISANIVITGSVNESVAGSYLLSYSVSDNSGNSAIPVNRTVNINDDAPVITLVGSNVINHPAGPSFTDPGASASDDVDGDISANIIVTGTVDENALGTYQLTYSVSDSGSNQATPINRTVNVFDDVFPIITLNGKANMAFIAGDGFSDPGASASDNFDGNLTASLNISGNVDSDTPGIYSLTYDVSDTAGNAASSVLGTVSVILDNDRDGTPDFSDSDDDNDGVADFNDASPFNENNAFRPAWSDVSNVEFADHPDDGQIVLRAKLVYAIDLDDDGDIDLISASDYEDRIVWFENDGFQKFTYHSLNYFIGDPAFIMSIDIDGDGHKDILATDEGESSVVLFENDGEENFTRQFVSTSSPTWYLHSLDVDKDNDLDLIVGSEGNVSWLENDGSQSFTEHIVTTNEGNDFNWVNAEDIDDDGDIDLVSASYFDETVAWYENDGAQNFTQRIVSSEPTRVKFAFVKDIDSDGEFDLISTNGNTVNWYENDGSGNFTTSTLLLGFSHDSVYAEDVDQDGDIDVVSSDFHDGRVDWHENDGSQVFTRHAVDQSSPFINAAAGYSTGAFSTYGGSSIFVIDIDVDGDFDFVSASANEAKVAWYENDGEMNFFKRVIDTAAENARLVIAEDLDMDGDMDLVASYDNTAFAGSDNAVVFYENDGNQAFTKSEIATSAWGARDLSADDLDGDGDKDIILAKSNSLGNGWYENQGGLNFRYRSVKQSATANSVDTSDIDGDGDGDLDLLFVADNDISWHEQQTQLTLTEGFTQISTESATDSDGQTLFYSITGGADASLFSINSNSAELGFISAPLVALPLDSNGDGIYEVIVRVSDGDLSRSRSLHIEVVE